MRKLQIQSETEASNLNGHVITNDMQGDTFQGPNVRKRTAHGKAAIVSSLWNLLLTPFIVILFAKVYHNTVLDNIFPGLKAINANSPSFVYFMFHVFTSFFGYHFGWLACSLCMQQIGYALPLTQLHQSQFWWHTCHGFARGPKFPCLVNQRTKFTFFLRVRFFSWRSSLRQRTTYGKAKEWSWPKHTTFFGFHLTTVCFVNDKALSLIVW